MTQLKLFYAPYTGQGIKQLEQNLNNFLVAIGDLFTSHSYLVYDEKILCTVQYNAPESPKIEDAPEQ